MTKVAVIDDHVIVQMGLKYILDSRRGAYEFVGGWPGAEGAVDFVARTKPDIILLDIRMPEKDGIAVLDDILAAFPDQKVIMLTTSDADGDVYLAFSHGAKGYLIKDLDAPKIHEAIDAVMAGGRFAPPEIQELYRKYEKSPKLSPREMEIMSLVADGRTNDNIAGILDIGLDTVKKHLASAFIKLGANNRVVAVRTAEARGLLRSPHDRE